MGLFRDLLFTDYGLMSFIVILIVIIMAFWFNSFFRRKMAEDLKNSQS